MPGVAWDLLPMDRYRAHNWHCLGGLRPAALRRPVHDAGLPVPLLVLLHPGPVQERRAGRRACKESVNSYRFWSPDTVIDADRHAGQPLRRAQHQDRRRDVRPEPPARPGHLRPDHRARLRPEHLGLHARRYDQGRHARQAEGGGLQLAGRSASRRARTASAPTWTRASTRRRSTASSSDVRAAGINVIGNYIFGLPEDDLDTMQATLDLALDLNCEFANFYSAMAYPGSPLYDAGRCGRACRCRARWTGYSQHSRDCLPLPTRHLPAREVLRFRDEAFQTLLHPPALPRHGRPHASARRPSQHIRHDDGLPARARPADRPTRRAGHAADAGRTDLRSCGGDAAALACPLVEGGSREESGVERRLRRSVCRVGPGRQLIELLPMAQRDQRVAGLHQGVAGRVEEHVARRPS